VRPQEPVVTRGAATKSTRMDEAKGARNEYNDIIIVIRHFLLFGQFLGFKGSSGPSNVTRFSSIAASSGMSS
jgi:hypothetical protein